MPISERPNFTSKHLLGWLKWCMIWLQCPHLNSKASADRGVLMILIDLSEFKCNFMKELASLCSSACCGGCILAVHNTKTFDLWSRVKHQMLGMMKCDKYVLLILHENRVLLQLTNVISLIFVGGKWIQIQGKVIYPKYCKNSNKSSVFVSVQR